MQTGSLSAVEYFAKNPYDGIKSEWQDFEAELRTAINANCGDNGIEYLFTRWPNNKIDNPQFLPKKMLEDLDDAEEIEAQSPNGSAQRIRITYEMRRDRREQNKARREHNDWLDALKQKVYKVFTSRISRSLHKELRDFDGDLIIFYSYMLETYGPVSLGIQKKGDACMKLFSKNEKRQKIQQFPHQFQSLNGPDRNL